MRKQRMFLASLMALDARICPTANTFSQQVTALVADVTSQCATPTAAQLQSIKVLVVPGASNPCVPQPVVLKDTTATSDVTSWAENILVATESYLQGSTSNSDFTQTDTVTATNDNTGYGAVDSGYGGNVYCFDGPQPIDTTFNPVGSSPNGPSTDPGTWTQQASSAYQNALQSQDIYGDPWS